MRWNLTLTQPVLGEEEVEALTRVIRSNWLTQGEEVGSFEQEFRQKMNVKHAIAVTNCTAALHLAYVAVGVGAGDEVICPSLTFVATANAARYAGADVVFAGVCSRDDLTIDPAAIEAAITPRTRAIAVMHYGGFCCRMAEILEMAASRDLPVVEDCAHAPFSYTEKADGERCYAGAMGAVGCFSFFGNKNLTTGEGGMVTTNDDALAARVRLLRSHGMTTLTYERHKGHASAYDVVDAGFNYRMDELRAALGRCQLERIGELNEARRRVTAWYREELAGIPGIHVPFSSRPLEASACHLMEVVVDRTQHAAVRQALQQRLIQTSCHYEPVPNFTAYRGQASPRPLFDDAALLTLPLGPLMTREQVAEVGHAIRSACLIRAA